MCVCVFDGSLSNKLNAVFLHYEPTAVVLWTVDSEMDDGEICHFAVSSREREGKKERERLCWPLWERKSYSFPDPPLAQFVQIWQAILF